MLATPTFYLMWVAHCLGTTAGQMAISQLVPFAGSAGLGALASTLVLPVSASGNAGGRILRLDVGSVRPSGNAEDHDPHFGGGDAGARALASTAGALLHPGSRRYWCYGTQLSVFASTTADFYGTRNLGLNYGVLFTAWGAAGILGPAIAGRAFDRFGDYRVAFFSAGVLALVALASLAAAKAPTKSDQVVSA